MNLNNEDKLTCPVCGEKVFNLLGHIKIHNPKIRSKKTFFEFFPDYKGKLMVDCTKSHELKCPYCDKVYSKNNLLQLHIKNAHPEHYVKEEKIRKCAGLICPICGKKVSDMKQHIKSHDYYVWEDFCREFNWDIKLVKNITDEYRNNLSKNKKRFYQSERGLQLRQEQSVKWQINNPVSNPDILEKAIHSRTVNMNIPNYGAMGLHVTTDYASFRSFNEFIFDSICRLNNIIPIYESPEYAIKWFNSKKNFRTTYIPDFYIDGIGLIELKSTDKDALFSSTEEKYIKAKEIFDSLNIKYQICSLNDALSIFGFKYTFKEKIEIKKYVHDLVKENRIKFVSYRSSTILSWLFDTTDYANLPFIKIIKQQ